MSNQMSLVPKITKMAKWLQALNNNRDITASHHRILHIVRDMNTTVQIIAGLTSIHPNKVREKLNELERWGLVSVVETRKRDRKIWGLHDDFRSMNKVPTYPSVTQEATLDRKRATAGRKLEMDEMATILWGEQENRSGAVSEALVTIATEIRKAPIETRIAGDVAARRQSAVTSDKLEWSLEDFVESDEEE